MDEPTPIRLEGVQGEGQKKNDLIFCGRAEAPKENIVFFGGDIQVAFKTGDRQNV